MINDMIPTTNAPETTADQAPETHTGSTHTVVPDAEMHVPDTEMAQIEPAVHAVVETKVNESDIDTNVEVTENTEETLPHSDLNSENVKPKTVRPKIKKSADKIDEPLAIAIHTNGAAIADDNLDEDIKEVYKNDKVDAVPAKVETTEPNNMIPEVLNKIRTRIEALELQALETPENFKTFWSQVKVTNENFKHYSKLIPKEAHEEFWKRFDQVCEKAKQTQEQIKSRFENVSRTKRAAIESAVNEASELIATDLTKADVLLRKALKYLKDDWAEIKNALSLSEDELKVRMGREDQDAAWQLWKTTNEHYMTQQQQLRQNNFIAINKEVMSIKESVETGDPFEALELIKKMQAKLRGINLPRGDWEEIQTVLREYWDNADKRLKTEKQKRTVDRRNKDSIFVVKHQQWLTRLESNVQRFKDLIRKNEEVLKNLEEHTEKLKNDLTTAMSDKFKDKIEDWIKEKENKIADIIRTNVDLEKRIVDIKKKLAEGDNTEESEQTDKTLKSTIVAKQPAEQIEVPHAVASNEAIEASAPNMVETHDTKVSNDAPLSEEPSASLDEQA